MSETTKMNEIREAINTIEGFINTVELAIDHGLDIGEEEFETYEKIKNKETVLFPRATAFRMCRLYNSEGIEEKIKEIEQILGIELTGQQINYILTGKWKCCGTTTAEAIREYISNTDSIFVIKKGLGEDREHENRIKENIYKKIAEGQGKELEIHKR